MAALLAALAFSSGLAASASAHADEPAPAPAVSAEAAFSQGLASYEAKRFAEAIATWESLVRSLGEERGFKVLYNLGLAHQAAGDASRSIERFEAFLRHLAAQPTQLTRELEERRQDAAERLHAMKAAHGAVIVPASPGRANAVKIDGATPRAAGFTAYLSPGEHAIELFSGSSDARTVVVRLTAGTSQTVDTTPPAAPLAPATVVLVAPPEIPPQFPTALVLGGGILAAASFVLPIGLGIRATEARESALALGPGHTGYLAAAQRFDDARTTYAASFALPAALGLATLATAAVSLVRVRTYRPQTGSTTLSLGPGGAWLTRDF